MAEPTPEYVAQRVLDALDARDWGSLEKHSFVAVRDTMRTWSAERVHDYVEANLSRISDYLRSREVYQVQDGEAPVYELDNEPSPYIRRRSEVDTDILRALQALDWGRFEELCGSILSRLGASSVHMTPPTRDGGVDVIGFNLCHQKGAVPVPDVAKLCVLVQAKRYARGNNVKETELRTFVGGADLWVERLRRTKTIRVVTPIVYAFWATSDFDVAAKRYARKMGIWHMNGPTIAAVVKALKLEL